MALLKCTDACFFFVYDSLSALKAFQSNHPFHRYVANIYKCVIVTLHGMKCKALFIWIRSQIGIHLNEVVDGLARQATEKVTFGIVGDECIGLMKNEMKRVREEWENSSIGERVEHNETLQHYIYVMNNTNVIYG